MKNEMFVPVTRIQSSPDVKNDGKARVGTGKPTLTQQGIDVDKFIRENHTLIERLRKGTMTNTAIQEHKPQPEPENPRAVIVNALVNIYDAISVLQRAAYHANDKVVYGFATKLLNGELMDLKANYSKGNK